MAIIDYVALGGGILFLLLGIVFGFGKGLKFFTGGIFGIIISVVVCYFVYGIVVSIGPIQDLMIKFGDKLPSAVKVNVWLPSIVTGIILFVVVQLARILIVRIIKSITEINNPVMKVINKTLGAVFFLAMFIAIMLLVFQICNWANIDVDNWFDGTKLGMRWLFEHNPLNQVFEMWLGK